MADLSDGKCLKIAIPSYSRCSSIRFIILRSDTYLLTGVDDYVGLDWEVGLFGEDFFPDEMLTHSTPLSTSSLARLLTYAPEDKKVFSPFRTYSSAQLRPFVLLLSATLAPRAELYAGFSASGGLH